MNKTLNRRTFLRSTGACIALPFLDAMIPARTTGANISSPYRFAASIIPFGVYGDTWWPATDDTGSDYQMPEVLSELAPIRDKVTVFSGIDHNLKGGHHITHSLLTGVPKDRGPEMPDGCISLDQRIAELVGSDTRYPSLNLWSSGSSFTRMSAEKEAIDNPYATFQLLFGNPEVSVQQRQQAILTDQSILDTVLASAKTLKRLLGQQDRHRIDEYLESIRGVERHLASSKKWLHQSKPKVNYNANELRREPSVANSILEESKVYDSWYDLMHLALQTDSTRSIVLKIGGKGAFSDSHGFGTYDYHALSHHGSRPEKTKALNHLERIHLKQWRRFIGKLKGTQEADGSTLHDRTVLFFGSGMSDGSRHTTYNLPIILSGAGFTHGNHINNRRQQPLTSLYLSILHAMGHDVPSFAGNEKTFTGLSR